MSIFDEDSYLTVDKEASGFHKDKSSKFYGFVIPIANESEVKEHLKILKKEHYDARHICYAYTLGIKQEKYRSNDDGEPRHSAGDPILRKLKSHELTNILLAVVRYFGGTKLGMSGLIQAYGTTAEITIKNSTIIKKVANEHLMLKFNYILMNDVMRIIRDYNIEIKEREFDEDCKMEVAVRKLIVDEVLAKLKKIRNLSIDKIPS